MTTPSFENKGSKYTFSWPEYALKAEVSRINVNHDSTRCLLIFTSTHPEANPHILQTRFNLESARTRSELAKEMAIRYKIKELIDWKNLIEYLSVKTIREYEKGEPLVTISSEDQSYPLEYLIYPVAPLNKPTVIFGNPGSGKSQLAVILNILIAKPWQDNPLRLKAPTNPVPALFLDYEADEEDVRRQLVSLSKGMELGEVQLNYRRCSLPLAEDIEAIQSHLETLGAQCLFIDSMSLAAGGDLNRMDIATAYFRALRRLKGITSISFAHTSKEQESKTKSIIGSILWEAGARSVWEIRGEEDEGTFQIGLFHRKANLSKRYKPLGYQINYENDLPVGVHWLDPKSVPEFVERMKNKERILEALKQNQPQTAKELTEELGLSYPAVGMALSRLEKTKQVVKQEGKRWALLSYFT